VAEGPDFSNLVVNCYGNYSIRQLVLYGKHFGWMAFRELSPKVLGSVWLQASMIGEGGPCPAPATTYNNLFDA
jgi:hypothetical protein